MGDKVEVREWSRRRIKSIQIFAVVIKSSERRSDGNEGANRLF
jgi:hypothetical protein